MSDVSQNVSLEDVLQVVEDNLLPSGSRIIDTAGKKDKQVYPKEKKIIKGNVAEELGYDTSDDDAEK